MNTINQRNRIQHQITILSGWELWKLFGNNINNYQQNRLLNHLNLVNFEFDCMLINDLILILWYFVRLYVNSLDEH